MTTIQELASVVRSKNAGPFILTFDLFFEDESDYERVRDADAITVEKIATLYEIDEGDILGIYTLDRINAIKISIRRPVAAGDVNDTDVYGTQQHVALLDIEV